MDQCVKVCNVFFERNNAMTPSTHSNTELKEYMEKNKYNKNPIIDLSRHAAKVDELELSRESSTEKKKTLAREDNEHRVTQTKHHLKRRSVMISNVPRLVPRLSKFHRRPKHAKRLKVMPTSPYLRRFATILIGTNQHNTSKHKISRKNFQICVKRLQDFL